MTDAERQKHLITCQLLLYMLEDIQRGVDCYQEVSDTLDSALSEIKDMVDAKADEVTRVFDSLPFIRLSEEGRRCLSYLTDDFPLDDSYHLRVGCIVDGLEYYIDELKNGDDLDGYIQVEGP